MRSRFTFVERATPDPAGALAVGETNKISGGSAILFHRLAIMKDIVITVIIDIYVIFAALRPLRLLCGGRSILTLPDPERVLAFEQSALLVDGRAFHGRLNTPKPGLPWGACSDICVAYLGSGSGPGVVVSPQFRRLDTEMLCKRRNSHSGGGHSPDHNFSWDRSNSAGP